MIVSIVAGVASVLFLLAGLDAWNLILATIVGATIGVLLPKPKKEKDSNQLES